MPNYQHGESNKCKNNQKLEIVLNTNAIKQHMYPITTVLCDVALGLCNLAFNNCTTTDLKALLYSSPVDPIPSRSS